MGFRFQLASNNAHQMFAKGYAFTDGEREARNDRELLEMFIAHGVTEHHAWAGTERHRSEQAVDVMAGAESDSSLDAIVREAGLAAQLGIPFNPMLMLGNHFAAQGVQPAPRFEEYPEIELEGPWESLGTDEMERHLHTYGAIAAAAIGETGVDVNVWDLGQEVDYGVAGVHPVPAQHDWRGDYSPPDGVDPSIGTMTFDELEDRRSRSDGAIEWLERHVWPHEARLLAATAEGIRSIDPNAVISSHIVLQPPALEFARAFWRVMWSGGFNVDQLGFSVFPSAAAHATGTFETQKEAMKILMADFGVPVMITEFAYPAGLAAEGQELFGWTNAIDGYPLSEDGQARFLEDALVWAQSEGVAGIRYWGPEYIDTPVWADMAFFRREGKIGVARPVLHAMERARERRTEGIWR